jgi:DNA repair protein RecO (recombination protein O)
MLANNQAIVLRAVKYSETSLICDFFTREWGLRTYIINGVRQAAPTIAPLLLKPASLLDFVAYHQPEKDINRLKEVKPTHVYQQIPFSVSHGSVALFCCELLQKVLRDNPASTPLFDFISSFFISLDGCKKGLANLPLIFTAQLSTYLGFAPQINGYKPDYFFDYQNGTFLKERPTHLYCFNQPESQTLIDVFCTLSTQTDTLIVEKKLRTETLLALFDFYSYHITGFSELQSYKVLQAVF